MYDENEIPPHKRKKSKKVYVIEKRLTEAGAKREIKELQENIKTRMEWQTDWTNYEKLKHAEQALENINKKKENAPEWRRLNDYEYRVNEKTKDE